MQARVIELGGRAPGAGPSAQPKEASEAKGLGHETVRGDAVRRSSQGAERSHRSGVYQSLEAPPQGWLSIAKLSSHRLKRDGL